MCSFYHPLPRETSHKVYIASKVPFCSVIAISVVIDQVSSSRASTKQSIFRRCATLGVIPGFIGLFTAKLGWKSKQVAGGILIYFRGLYHEV